VQATTRWKRPAPARCGCKAGKVSVTVWPKQLKEICEKRNIHCLE
jgi:hypothetical protein